MSFTNYRIVILTSFFEEHIGYQEVQLAKVLHRIGHDVLVVATDRSNLDTERRYNNDSFVKVLRIRKVIRVRNTFLPLIGVRKHILAFDPDIALIIHPGSGLPYFYLPSLPKKCKVISFFGDLEVVNKVGRAVGIKGNIWIQKIMKDRWYNKTFNRSNVIVANTNETVEILNKCANKSIEDKMIMPGLGFDPELYFHSPDLRAKTRNVLKVSEDQMVLVTVTRIYAGKPVLQWLDPLIVSLKQNPKLVYILAGFADTDFSRQVKYELLKLNLDDRLKLLDFTTAEFNNALFNAADFSIWFLPTISIQQSMATGLPAIIPFDKTLDHLVEDNSNGMYYADFSELGKIMSELRSWEKSRNDVAELNKKFSYESIIQLLFSRIGN